MSPAVEIMNSVVILAYEQDFSTCAATRPLLYQRQQKFAEVGAQNYERNRLRASRVQNYGHDDIQPGVTVLVQIQVAALHFSSAKRGG